jgi:hypothetical protein
MVNKNPRLLIICDSFAINEDVEALTNAIQEAPPGKVIFAMGIKGIYNLDTGSGVSFGCCRNN